MARLLNLYCVIDARAKTIIGPIVHDHSEVPIVRQITEAVNKPDSMIAKNPEDFYIVQIGQVDEETGELYVDTLDAKPLDGPDGNVFKGMTQLVTRAVALQAASS